MEKWIFSIIVMTNLVYGSNIDKINNIKELKTFVFGSCNSQSKVQPLWSSMLEQSPDLFMWGGDNIYADTSDPKILLEKYVLQNSNPDYQSLKEKTAIIGTWDDHDYGQNDATYDNPIKYISQQLFLDFLDEPNKSIRRYQQGVYTSYTFGPREKEVKMILLDNRFHLKKPEDGNDILGKEQWTWLENILKYSRSKIHFIATGLSILSPRIPYTEEWADYPGAQTRLFKLLKKYKVKGVVFLTGDKHYATIFQRHGHLEFMSSGLTHTVSSRVLRTYVSRFYPIAFFGLNYGLVKIAWIHNTPKLHFEIKSTNNHTPFIREFILDSNNQWKKYKLSVRSFH